MDTGEGRFEEFEYKPLEEYDNLKKKYPNAKGEFHVGERLKIKGSLFKVKDISPFGMKLKLLKRED